jgi:hypothetical protein
VTDSSALVWSAEAVQAAVDILPELLKVANAGVDEAAKAKAGEDGFTGEGDSWFVLGWGVIALSTVSQR